ncbi:MAG: response regulator [Syntrophobacteraceae bacterium]|nr:response regulator [Desulfobacteraceae bacterium]
MSKILIVDDDETLRYLIAEYLQRKGYDCTSAGDVAEARTHMSEEDFHLAISDFNMPTESGLDLLKYVSVKSPSTPFILMSGEADSRLRKQALELGAAACVAKPFQMHELLERVENALH